MLLYFWDKTDLNSLSAGDFGVVHSVHRVVHSYQLYVLNGPHIRVNLPPSKNLINRKICWTCQFM